MGNALGYNLMEKATVCMPWWVVSELPCELSLRVQHLTVRCETMTQDTVFVTVVASVQYRASEDKAAGGYYKLSNTEELIQAYVFDVITGSVPRIPLVSIFQQKNDIEKGIAAQLQKGMSMYGYEIVETLIVDIIVDERVKKSMEEYKAEKVMRRKRGYNEADSMCYSGIGIAKQRQTIVDGLKESVLMLSSDIPGVSAKDAMDMILVTYYFDTMEKIAASSNSTSVFVPHGLGAIKDVTSEMHSLVKSE